MNNETITKAKEIIELQAERTSLKTMADYVKEHLIAYCDTDPDFVERVNSPEKSFMDCIGYIKKKAMEWLKEQQKLELSNYAQGVGGDVPNNICYDWAVEYYYSKPEPKPEVKKTDNASKTKAGKKGTTVKEARKEASKNSQMTLLDATKSDEKAEPITLFDSVEKEKADNDADTGSECGDVCEEEETGESGSDLQFESEEWGKTTGAIADIVFEGMIEEPVDEDELPFFKEAV